MLELNPPETHEKCPVCRGSGLAARPLRDAPSYKQSHYWKCASCGTIFLWPLPEREENLPFEGTENANALAVADDARLDLLRRRVVLAGAPEPGRDRLLDIGCSSGRVMALAREAGWDVTGIEMSAALADEARRHVPGAPIITGDVMALDPGNFAPFDAILSLDVIEHVLDPAAFIARCRDLLCPGGRLVLHTPNARSIRARLHGGQWNMLLPEYHFTLLTAPALERLLREAGFENVKITTASGTGEEAGLRRKTAYVKEAVLSWGNLGNALLAIARFKTDTLQA